VCRSPCADHQLSQAGVFLTGSRIFEKKRKRKGEKEKEKKRKKKREKNMT
jgi:hypothetical protein